MKFICSLITVENINVSKEFYENILKQKVKYDFGENITFESGFAIHLKSHFSNLIDGKKIVSESNSFELYFEEDDVETFVKILKKNDIELVHEVMEQPWRQKVVRFYDPDKHIVEVGESIEFLAFRLHKEGMNTIEISKIINLPEPFVLDAIKQIKGE